MISIRRIVAIAFVFGCATVAWLILGAIMMARTDEQTYDLKGDVAELWGSPHRQQAPNLTFQWQTWEDRVRTEKVDGRTREIRTREKVVHTKEVSPLRTRIDVDLGLDQRLKGLMWYSLYDVGFDGTWVYQHTEPVAGHLILTFGFPDASGLYDDFRFVIDGQDLGNTLRPQDGQVSTTMRIEPGQTVELAIGYRSRGMDEWVYAPATGVANLEDFTLTMTTDFANIDFPMNSMSPSNKKRTTEGWVLDWTFARVVTGRYIGMVTPARIQPGKMASELSFSAPISLMFFFLLIFVLATLRGIDIHPINYFFLAGAFFAFHLLFGYSVDHLTLIPAFVASSVVSIVLVTSYLRLVVSPRFALVEAAGAQLVYLIGFSMAHFWKGFTGLTVTVLSILTLFILMQLTGRLNWSEVMSTSKPSKPRPRSGDNEQPARP